MGRARDEPGHRGDPWLPRRADGHPARPARQPRAGARGAPHGRDRRGQAGRVGHRGAPRHRQDRRGRRAAARVRQIGRPARRHGLPADGRADQPALPQPHCRAHARLRPRRPHHHAAGRRALPGGVAGFPGHRAFHLPAGRGGRRRGAGHAGGRAVREISRAMRSSPCTTGRACRSGSIAIGKGPQAAGGAFFDIAITGRRRAWREAGEEHRSGAGGGAHHHGAAVGGGAQRAAVGHGRAERDARDCGGCLQRHTADGQAVRHGARLQRRDDAADRAGRAAHRQGRGGRDWVRRPRSTSA